MLSTKAFFISSSHFHILLTSQTIVKMSGGGVDIMDRFWSAPPVSRTIVAAMLVESALVHSGLVSGTRVIFYTSWIFKFPPELWRLLSSFLLTGGGLSFLFDLYFSKSTSHTAQLNMLTNLQCLHMLLVWSSPLQGSLNRVTSSPMFSSWPPSFWYV